MAHTLPPEPPAALSEDWEWQLRGSCRQADGELFFHPYGERDPSRSRRDQAAQQVCRSCPVLDRCREYALAAREPYGVWGGLSETERFEILDRRDADKAADRPRRSVADVA